MENKKTAFLVISLVILIILVIGLGGYIVYDKFLKDEGKVFLSTKPTTSSNALPIAAEIIDTAAVQAAKLNSLSLNLKDYEGQEINLFPKKYELISQINVTTDGKAYITANEEYENKKIYKSIADKYVYTGIMQEGDNKLMGLYLTDQVVYAYYSYVGNGGYSALFLVKTDGTVSIINFEDEFGFKFDENGKVLIENNYRDLKNIARIFNLPVMGAWGVTFVDINGVRY